VLSHWAPSAVVSSSVSAQPTIQPWERQQLKKLVEPPKAQEGVHWATLLVEDAQCQTHVANDANCWRGDAAEAATGASFVGMLIEHSMRASADEPHHVGPPVIALKKARVLVEEGLYQLRQAAKMGA